MSFGSKAWIQLLAVSFIFCLGCSPSAQTGSGPGQDVHLLQVPSKPDNLPITRITQTDGELSHDGASFTQGLLFHKGFLYESTGQRGKSKVRKLDPESGTVIQETPLDEQFFGEGLAVLDDTLYQLTWQAGVCQLYDLELQPKKQLFYGTQGWGLTVQPETNLLVFSDGSSQIRFLDSKNLVSKGRLTVVDGNGQTLSNLNELEWVQGEIWANIWTSAVVARIDPVQGKVLGWIDFTEVVRQNQTSHEDVLNGLAYDPESDTLWFTGKLWPKVFRLDGVKDRFFGPD